MPNAQPKRCPSVNVDQVLMREYHDREWSVPAHDDRTHFAFLILEAARAGLNWSLVLNKGKGYRRAFSDFNPKKVARYSAVRIAKLTADPPGSSSDPPQSTATCRQSGWSAIISSTVSDIATFGGSAPVANEPDPAAIVKSANDKCDAIVQERVWLSLLGWGSARAALGTPHD